MKSFVAYNNIPNVTPKLQNNTLHLLKDVYEEEHVENDDLVTTSEVEDFVILTRTDDPYKSTRKLVHLESRIIVFDTGCYELKDVQDVILRDKLHTEHKTEMIIDFVLMKVGIKSLWTLDMSAQNSIGSTLGFEKKMYPPTGDGDYVWSTKPIDLFSIHNIRIKSNLTCCNVQDSNLHDSTLYEFPQDSNLHDSTLYEFPLSVGPTEKIIERPINPEFYRVTSERLYYLSVIIVDQNDRLIDFLGEKITVLLHFRPERY